MVLQNLTTLAKLGWHIFVDLDTYLNIFQIKLLMRFVSFTFMDKRPSSLSLLWKYIYTGGTTKFYVI